MGRDKALVRIADAPMASRVARACLDAGASRVRAVGGDVPALRDVGLDAVADRWPGAGPLAGIVQALDTANQPVVVVLACDLVAPDAAAIGTLVDRLTRSDADVVVPGVDGRPQWLHGAWRRAAAGKLATRFAAGERAVHRAAVALAVDVVDGLDPAALADADHPSALPDDAD